MHDMEDLFKIIVVDDNMRPYAPFIKRLEKKFSRASVVLFKDVEHALSYILDNIESKMVVFLDCKFDIGEQGIDGLKQIREKTSLVNIVMMSANALKEMENDDLYSMINSEDVFFIKNSDMNKAEEIVNNTLVRWQTHLDCVLEQWVQNHSQNERNAPYIRTEEGIMSLNDVLIQIRRRTGQGLRLERNILMLAIDMLTRDNVQAREV